MSREPEMKLAIKPWMLASLLIPALPASASDLFQPVEVSDHELASLRGRYVLPEGIVHFGVTMSTQWRTSNGATIGAQINLSVNNLAQANLTVSPLYEAGNGQLPGQGSGQIVGGQGLANVQGISQSVRSAGDYNRGENYVDVNISRQPGQALAGNGPALASPQQFSNEAGSVLASSVNGGLQLSLLANNNQGAASQFIGRGGIIQQANISGTVNQVRNLTSLTVALRETSRPQVNCSLAQLAIAPRAGY